MTTQRELMNRIVEKMSKNPKVLKAVEGMLEPLEQEGDSLTIRTSQKTANKKKDKGVLK